MRVEDELQAARDALFAKINLEFDRLLQALGDDDPAQAERVLPLSTDPAFFRKTRPVAVLFGDKRVAASNWRKVYMTVLEYCSQQPQYHHALMALRGRAAGKVRVFLADSPDGMRRPMLIDKGLYAESHYGSEGLMHILCKQILEPIRFDCSKIRIVIAAG